MLSAASASGEWIPLMDYAMRKGVSLSTLRRHIKARKVPYKIEHGKYLLLDPSPTVGSAAQQNADSRAAQVINDQASLQLTIEMMTTELQKAHEEIAELKTLIAFYEDRIPSPRLDV